MRFSDRTEAGIKLAQALQKYSGNSTVVLALPRGGVPVGAEVAKAIKAPLDVALVRKIGHPQNPEYAIAAIGESGEMVLEKSEVLGVSHDWFTAEIARQRKLIEERRKLYLHGRKPLPLKGKTVILVDDGLATGLTMKAAVQEVEKRKPERIIVAAPVASQEAAMDLKKLSDEVISLYTAFHFGAVGNYYEDFRQVSDEEVADIIKRSIYAQNVQKTA